MSKSCANCNHYDIEHFIAGCIEILFPNGEECGCTNFELKSEVESNE